MTKIQIIWPDGKITTGKTWGELEEAVRCAQWTAFSTRREFRREMRRRAQVWTGNAPAPAPAGQTSRQFLQSLADVGMFMIARDETGDRLVAP